MRIFISSLAVALLCHSTVAGDLATGLAQKVFDSDSLEAWCVSPNVKIFHDKKLPDLPKGDVVRLRAARNEYEPRQLVLKSRQRISHVSLEFSTLRGVGELANCIIANPIGFFEIAATSTRRSLGKGLYPDALLKSETLDLEPDVNGIFWITVHAPESAKAGDYEAIVTVLGEGRELFRFRLVLTVWDITLPRETPIVIQGNFWPNVSWLRRYADRDMREITKEYFRNMAEHRINACPGIWSFPVFKPGETLKDRVESLSAFEEMASFVLDELGFKRFRFPGASAAGGMGLGVWRGQRVMSIPAKEGDIWIWANAPSKTFVAAQAPGARWMPDWGLRLMLGPVKEPSAFDGSWTEYEFTVQTAGAYRCWLEGGRMSSTEAFIDDMSLGIVQEKHDGLRLVPGSVTLTEGKHRLRLVVTRARGNVAAIFNLGFLSRRQDADPEKLFEKRSADPGFLRAYKHHLRLTGQYFAEHGWLKKAHVKIGDEPQPPAYPLVRELAHAVKEVLPNARTEVTIEPKPEFYGLIDIWVPYATRYNEEVARERQARGEEVWIYYNELHAIDCPALCMRAIGWLLWKFKLDGYHFWSINYCPLDPWTTPVSLTGNCYDRGTFVYPDPKDGSPVNSIRWEIFREGLEDYLYLYLTEKRVEAWSKEGASDALKQKVVSAMKHNLEIWSRVLVRNMRKWCEDAPRIGRARENLGELLQLASRLESGASKAEIEGAMKRIAETTEGLARPAFRGEVWRSGRDFDRSFAAGPADKQWGQYSSGASIVTRVDDPEKNPYNGSWVEYEMMLDAGEYRVWLRICQFQSSEVKEILIDGKPVGAIRSGPGVDGYTEFKTVGDPLRLERGKHTLRILCRGIVGWIDPIQWLYVTRNLDADPCKLEESHEQTSAPRRPGL